MWYRFPAVSYTGLTDVVINYGRFRKVLLSEIIPKHSSFYYYT